MITFSLARRENIENWIVINTRDDDFFAEGHTATTKPPRHM